jgi:RNA-directed DNA polymerase
MSTQLSQIAKKARLDRKARFTLLAHLLTPEFLTEVSRRGVFSAFR